MRKKQKVSTTLQLLQNTFIVIGWCTFDALLMRFVDALVMHFVNIIFDAHLMHYGDALSVHLFDALLMHVWYKL